MILGEGSECMSQRGGDALAYMGYYGEISDEDGQHAIYARPMSADLPDKLAGKVAHGWGSVEGPTVTNDHRCVPRKRVPQGTGEPWLQHSQPQSALSSRHCRVCTSTRMIGGIRT
jgi:hypothetical protein